MATVSKAKIEELRGAGLLKADENAIQEGDKIFAENFVTMERRLIVDQAVSTVTETKQLLKD